jgi:hypothetical protein
MKTLVALVVPAATLVAVACGSGNGSPAPTATPVTTATFATATATRPPATQTAPAAPSATRLPFSQTGSLTVPGTASTPSAVATLFAVRVGGHDEEGGFDRVVFEFKDSIPEAQIRFEQSASQCASGQAVPLPGAIVMGVRLSPAHAHNDAGQVTIDATEVDGTVRRSCRRSRPAISRPWWSGRLA